ncbi:YhbD family protein [Alicyclobacillus sacchari]|uniref:YhbD family protein n=1 Tax=Alicyclobacillus sacchari TaxID=392010 RepID=UPI0024E06F0C|nr:YhbD family protein [Alicyclobacillus sacchari]
MLCYDSCAGDGGCGTGVDFKKELLDVTGISYGQLYRWKRKDLIPEEWFIRKSTFTGQETFFPREKILTRIEQIKQLKDDLSLDELARRFSPDPAEIALSGEEMVRKGIVSEQSWRVYQLEHPNVAVCSFQETVFASVVHRALASGDVGLDEARSALRALEQSITVFSDLRVRIVCVRKLGVSVWVVQAADGQLVVDPDAKLVFEADVSECIEELKLKLM